MTFSIHEGTIPFKGYKTWYRIIGDGEEPGKLPLLCLHGGPGVAHDYLESLDAMAATGRRVIYYDQLGCGNSHLDVSKAMAAYAGEMGDGPKRADLELREDELKR